MKRLKHYLPSRKKVFRFFLISMGGIFAFLLFTHFRIEFVSDNYVSNDLKRLPSVKVGIVPGTSKFLSNGSINQYFQNRIDAAVRLYESGKIQYFLISGDNGRKDYNEPLDMRISLMEEGIPDSVIYLDYAGFDTYDSMIRAKKVFGQQRFIVISQEFQNERAVYIARRFGIEAYGYNAKDVAYAGGIRTKIREFFARGKAYVEVNLGVEPTYLGERIRIP
ncbi:MAG: vancomycin high temperature exclusion protein [Fluviicola sp.]